MNVTAPSSASLGTQERVWGMVLSLKTSSYGAPKLQTSPRPPRPHGRWRSSRVVGRRLVTLPRGRDRENRGLGRRWVTRRKNPSSIKPRAPPRAASRRHPSPLRRVKPSHVTLIRSPDGFWQRCSSYTSWWTRPSKRRVEAFRGPAPAAVL